MNTIIENNPFSDQEISKQLTGFTNHYAQINDIRMHYVMGGSGEPLVLLPGWPHTWWSYHKVMPELALHFTVIAVDIRGMGSSDKPSEGYDKKNMARDIYGLINALGYDSVYIVGHDIGAMVAYSFAQNFAQATKKLVMLDAVHPDAGLYNLTLLPTPGTFDSSQKASPVAPYLWWFAFHQVKHVPEQLLLGRVHVEHDWFFNYLLPDERSINAFDRSVYAFAYDSLDGIRAGNAWFQAYEQDIIDEKTYAKLDVPTLAIGGASFGWMSDVLPGKINVVNLVQLEECGHFPAEEQPEATALHIINFLT